MVTMDTEWQQARRPHCGTSVVSDIQHDTALDRVSEQPSPVVPQDEHRDLCPRSGARPNMPMKPTCQ